MPQSQPPTPEPSVSIVFNVDQATELTKVFSFGASKPVIRLENRGRRPARVGAMVGGEFLAVITLRGGQVLEPLQWTKGPGIYAQPA